MPKKSTTTKTDKVVASSTGKQVLADVFAGRQVSPEVLGAVLVALQHNLHRPTAHTKTRGEVQGTTRKPWRQKGTGRARVGTKRNPIWRGGGIAFGPRSNRNFNRKINQRILLPALTTALVHQAGNNRIIQLAQNYTLGNKTKAGLSYFAGNLDPKSNLVVIDTVSLELNKAMGNLPYITLRTAAQLNAFDVMRHRRIILVGDALDSLLKRIK